MNTAKKIYYVIKNKAGLFFAGWDADERKDTFKTSHYYLYDLNVAQSRIKNINNANELEIVVSPVQDDSVWDEPNPYTTGKRK